MKLIEESEDFDTLVSVRGRLLKVNVEFYFQIDPDDYSVLLSDKPEVMRGPHGIKLYKSDMEEQDVVEIENEIKDRISKVRVDKYLNPEPEYNPEDRMEDS